MLYSIPLILFWKILNSSLGLSDLTNRNSDVNVLEDDSIREGIKAFSEWPTIPQVFVRGEFIGGSDILVQMHQDGELEEALGLTEEKPE